MKKLLLLLLALTVIPVSAIWSQDGGTTVFGGLRYDDKVFGSLGSAQTLSPNVWIFEYVDVSLRADSGVHISAAVDFAYLVDCPGLSALKVGILAGPDADWIGEVNDDRPLVSYLVGSGGWMASLRISEKIGAWGALKYKFKFDNNQLYRNGYIFGAGVFMGL